jgi:hypothetical protein
MAARALFCSSSPLSGFDREDDNDHRHHLRSERISDRFAAGNTLFADRKRGNSRPRGHDCAVKARASLAAVSSRGEWMNLLVGWSRLRDDDALFMSRVSSLPVDAYRHLHENKVVREHFAGATPDLGTMNHLIVDALARRRPPPIALLDETSLVVAGFDLSETFLVASLHLLDDGDALLAALERHGLDPAKSAILGKPYSTNMPVVLRLRRRGYTVHRASYEMDEREPLRRAHEEAGRAMLRSAMSWCAGRPRGTILILDSGGTLIRLAHEEEFAPVRRRCSAVECTSQGLFELDDVALDLPVINVARSWAKVTYESQAIGANVVGEVDSHLRHLGASVENALVIGYGTIGRCVARCLDRLGMRVTVVDPGVTHPDVEAGHHHARDRRDALQRAQLVIGCSGRPSLRRADWDRLLDGVFLASASSYDIEFNGWELRRMYRPHELGVATDPRGFDRLDGGGGALLGSRDDPSHYTYPIRFDDGRLIHLLNGGCPVNFTGRPFALPPDASALTMSLRLCGVAQAAATDGAGILPLRMDWQQEVVKRRQDDTARDLAPTG